MQQYSDKRPLRRSVDPQREDAAVEGFDPVTGLAGRDQFHARAEEQWEHMAKRNKPRPITVALVSIDHFSECAEDTAKLCLRSVAQVIADTCKRRADFAGRMREHEFAIMLSEVDTAGAQKLLESIRSKVELLHLMSGDGGTQITVSVGISTQTPRANRFIDSLIITAIKGLQQAQRKGGNCVESVHE